MIQDTRRIWDVYTKVLSRKNISVEYSDNVRTAQYYLDDDTHNGRVVIPTFKFLDDETTQMLVSHEIGHALYSKYTQEQMKTYFDRYGDLFNIIEDAYIEKKIIDEYKGLLYIFNHGYNTLLKNNFFGILNDDIINLLPLYSRLNIYSKLGFHFPNINFNKDECSFAIRLKKLNSNEDVINLCEDILNYIKEKPQLTSDSQNNENSQDSENESRNDSNDKNDSDDSHTSDNEENSLRINSDAKNDHITIRDDISRNLENNLQEYGKSKLEKKYNNKRQNTVIINEENINEYIFDVTRYQNIIENTYWKNHNDDGNETVEIIKKLAKSADIIFQQRKSARQLQETRYRKVGKVDVKRISRYNTTSNIFKQVKSEYEFKNHGVVILIDCSNSMSGTLNHVFFQAAVLGEFCRKNEIPFEIIAFGMGITTKHDSKIMKPCVKIADSLHFSIPMILGFENGDMTFSGFKVCRWSTPLVEGLICASHTLKRYKQHNIEKTSLYIITDGLHDTYSYDCQNCYDNVSKIVYDNVLYDIDEILPIKKIHNDWIIELLCYRIKNLYDTYISVQFLYPFQVLKKALSDNVKQKLGIEMDVYSTNPSDEFFYIGKHLYYYTKNKFNWNNDSSMVSCNFTENPFIDQFQTMDTEFNQNKNQYKDKNSLYKNMLTFILTKYKLYKVMVTNYIVEIS